MLATNVISALRLTFSFGQFTTRQVCILLYLSMQRKPVDFADVALFVSISEQSLSQALKKLEKSKLAIRERRADKRFVDVSLTPGGRDLVAGMMRML